MTLVSASNGGNGAMSTFNNILSLTDTLSIGTETLGAASTTTQFAMLFGQSSSHVTLVEVELDSGSYILKQSGDIKTVEFSALKTAKDNGDITEVAGSFMPQNVITVSGATDVTFDINGTGTAGDTGGNLPAGKSYIILPQSNGDWSLQEATYNSGSTSWELVNGGVSINDVHTENIFGASNLVTANSEITTPSEASGTYVPEGGGSVHYEVRSLYEGAPGAITGVKAVVIKKEYDVFGNKTETDITDQLSAEGLTLNLKKDASIIQDGNGDGSWDYTTDSVDSYMGENLHFVLTKDSDSTEVGGNSVSIRSTHDQYRIEHRGTGIQDDANTSTINESKSIQFSIYDAFTGADATLAADGLQLNVFSHTSETDIATAGTPVLSAVSDLSTAIVYGDAANVSDYLFFNLVDTANANAQLAASGPYETSHIHQFSGSSGTQTTTNTPAPVTAATFADNGTSGMMQTDPIIVGSQSDNSFDLSSGSYSETPAGPSADAQKFNVAFGDSDEDSIVVSTSDSVLETKDATDVSIQGVKADGTKEDITASFVKTAGATTTFTAASIGDVDSYVSIEASIDGETQTHSISFQEDYAAFGGKGNDTATGVQAGDSFIGGDGNDTTFLTGAFKDYSFHEATDAQIETVVDNSLNEIISEKMTGTVSDADKASMKDVMMGTPKDGDPIFDLTENQFGTHAAGEYAIKGNVYTGYELQPVTESTPTYGGVTLTGTSWATAAPTATDTIAATDASLLTAAGVTGFSTGDPITGAILTSVQTYVDSETSGGGVYSASGAVINITDANPVSEFLNNALTTPVAGAGGGGGGGTSTYTGVSLGGTSFDNDSTPSVTTPITQADMTLLAAAGVDSAALGNITPASAVIYSGPDLSNTSFNGGSPSVGDTIATDDMVFLSAATVPGLTGVTPGTSTYNQSMISAAETFISNATTGGGGDAFTQPFINAVTSYISTQTTTGAGGGGGGGGGVTPASVLGHMPSTPLEKVVEISAPDADQSQIWAITNNGQHADSATTFVQSENINFEANPNMDLQIGPSAQTVYKVGSTDITQAGATPITLDANETYALSTTGTGANVVHTVHKVVAETGGGAPAGSYKLADGAQPITITSTTANTLDDNTVMGIYQPEYFLKEKVVASDSFAEQTVTLTLDSMLGDDQNLFWQINVDPNDPNSAQLEDFVETHGVVEVGAKDTSVDITIKVRNDGDQDEGNENFKVDLGYVVGPNKIENVKFDLMKEDNTVGDTQAVDITPTLAAKETLVDVAPAATAVAVNATPDLSSYSTTLTDSNTDGTIDSITVDLTSIGKGTIDIIGTDSIGNKLNMSSLGADGEISATDLEFAASGSNAYLSQASVNATIKGDPLEYYVFSGNSYHFLGMDFLGNVVKKNVQKTDTDVKSFSSIQEALTDAVTNVNVSEIRVAVNHDEQGSNTITIGKEDLKIDFWDEWDGSAAENHNAGSVLNFKLGDGIKAVEFGGIRDVNVTGNEEDNYIIGNDGNNKIYGGAGDDVLLAGDGNDTIKGGSGDDVLDGQDGADKVYGQRGDDIVVATGSEDLTALDLISGGSGDDVLVDAANKTSGEVVIVAGSGNDTISFGASRTNVDYQDGAPVSENTYTDRQINAHLIDLSKNDKLDLKGITSVVEADLPTTLLTGTDASGLTKTALTVADDITPRSSFDATENEYEIDLGIVGAKGLVATGLKIDDVDTNGNGSTTEAADEIAAPILAVSGEIEISLGSTSLVSTAMVNNSGNTYGVTQAVFDGVDDNGDGDFDDALDEVPLRELYGVNDNLIWIDTIA